MQNPEAIPRGVDSFACEQSSLGVEVKPSQQITTTENQPQQITTTENQPQQITTTENQSQQISTATENQSLDDSTQSPQQITTSNKDQQTFASTAKIESVPNTSESPLRAPQSQLHLSPSNASFTSWSTLSSTAPFQTMQNTQQHSTSKSIHLHQETNTNAYTNTNTNRNANANANTASRSSVPHANGTDDNRDPSITQRALFRNRLVLYTDTDFLLALDYSASLSSTYLGKRFTRFLTRVFFRRFGWILFAITVTAIIFWFILLCNLMHIDLRIYYTVSVVGIIYSLFTMLLLQPTLVHIALHHFETLFLLTNILLSSIALADMLAWSPVSVVGIPLYSLCYVNVLFMDALPTSFSVFDRKVNRLWGNHHESQSDSQGKDNSSFRRFRFSTMSQIFTRSSQVERQRSEYNPNTHHVRSFYQAQVQSTRGSADATNERHRSVHRIRQSSDLYREHEENQATESSHEGGQDHQLANQVEQSEPSGQMENSDAPQDHGLVYEPERQRSAPLRQSFVASVGITHPLFFSSSQPVSSSNPNHASAQPSGVRGVSNYGQSVSQTNPQTAPLSIGSQNQTGQRMMYGHQMLLTCLHNCKRFYQTIMHHRQEQIQISDRVQYQAKVLHLYSFNVFFSLLFAMAAPVILYFVVHLQLIPDLRIRSIGFLRVSITTDTICRSCCVNIFMFTLRRLVGTVRSPLKVHCIQRYLLRIPLTRSWEKFIGNDGQIDLRRFSVDSTVQHRLLIPHASVFSEADPRLSPPLETSSNGNNEFLDFAEQQDDSNNQFADDGPPELSSTIRRPSHNPMGFRKPSLAVSRRTSFAISRHTSVSYSRRGSTQPHPLYLLDYANPAFASSIASLSAYGIRKDSQVFSDAHALASAYDATSVRDGYSARDVHTRPEPLSSMAERLRRSSQSMAIPLELQPQGLNESEFAFDEAGIGSRMRVMVIVTPFEEKILLDFNQTILERICGRQIPTSILQRAQRWLRWLSVVWVLGLATFILDIMMPSSETSAIAVTILSLSLGHQLVLFLFYSKDAVKRVLRNFEVLYMILNALLMCVLLADYLDWNNPQSLLGSLTLFVTCLSGTLVDAHPETFESFQKGMTSVLDNKQSSSPSSSPSSDLTNNERLERVLKKLVSLIKLRLNLVALKIRPEFQDDAFVDTHPMRPQQYVPLNLLNRIRRKRNGLFNFLSLFDASILLRLSPRIVLLILIVDLALAIGLLLLICTDSVQNSRRHSLNTELGTWSNEGVIIVTLINMCILQFRRLYAYLRDPLRAISLDRRVVKMPYVQALHKSVWLDEEEEIPVQEPLRSNTRHRSSANSQNSDFTTNHRASASLQGKETNAIANPPIAPTISLLKSPHMTQSRVTIHVTGADTDVEGHTEEASVLNKQHTVHIPGAISATQA